MHERSELCPVLFAPIGLRLSTFCPGTGDHVGNLVDFYKSSDPIHWNYIFRFFLEIVPFWRKYENSTKYWKWLMLHDQKFIFGMVSSIFHGNSYTAFIHEWAEVNDNGNIVNFRCETTWTVSEQLLTWSLYWLDAFLFNTTSYNCVFCWTEWYEEANQRDKLNWFCEMSSQPQQSFRTFTHKQKEWNLIWNLLLCVCACGIFIVVVAIALCLL